MQDTPNSDPLRLIDYLAREFRQDRDPGSTQWEFPAQRTQVTNWRRMWLAIHRRQRRVADVAAIERAVLSYVAANRTDSSSHSIPSQHHANTTANSEPRRRWRGTTSTLAFSLGVLVLLTLGIVVSKPLISESWGHKGHVSIYTTARGHQETVTLPDGTMITLAPETVIHVHLPESGTRIVDLDGEAIFTVVHAEQRAFVVRTLGTATRVLGTTFGVRRYASDPATRVAVRQGKVAMNTLALAAGDIGEALPDGTTRMIQQGNVDAALRWMQGTLVFTDTPLSEIAAQLSRWYDIDVVLADTALSTLPFTLSLTVHRESLDNVMTSITRAANIRVTRQGRVFILSSSSENPRGY